MPDVEKPLALRLVDKAAAMDRALALLGAGQLKPVDLAALWVIATNTDNRTGVCERSQNWLASQLGHDPRHLRRSLRRLTVEGLIIGEQQLRKGRRAFNHYRIQIQASASRAREDDHVQTVGHGCPTEPCPEDTDVRSPADSDVRAYPFYEYPVSTEAKASADDPRQFVFDDGLKFLLGNSTRKEPALRSLLGKLRQKYGDQAVADALKSAINARPSEPIAFIQGCLRKGNRHERASGKAARPTKAAGSGAFVDAAYSLIVEEQLKADVP